MWVVAWEEGHHQHQTEAPTEAAAEAHAHNLIASRGLKRVTYFEIDMGDQ